MGESRDATKPSPGGAGPTAAAADRLVVGLFARLDDAGQALSNLAEAEYDPAGISVVAHPPDRARTLTDTPGPLAGLAPDALAAELTRRGLPDGEAVAYRAALLGGAVCIAVTAPDGSQDSAREILVDDRAERVHILPATTATP